MLCKFGVTYVKDPKTGKYIPTCNRTHYTPIYSDKNYQKAIELSSGEKKALFEEDAKTIDNIQKGIIAVSKKEKPFDIFISYKETDASGNRTKDSIEAQKLYEKLTESGYKVFFSRITLEDKIGSEYEPYIYAALYSSKVMITVSSSKENIEAVWVKNEWSRFLGFRQHDASKTLLPLYFDMDKSELPDEFALLSSYNMKTDGFEDELFRGIKKLIPLPIMKAKRRKQIAKAVGITAASLVVVVGIAAAIIIPQKLEEKRIQEEAIATENAYKSAVVLFENADYTGAADAFTALGDYKDSAYMVERCAIQPDYDAAMQLYYDGRYAEATWAFKALGDYEDAATQKENAELSWRKSLATVAVYNLVGNNNLGSYYVTPNGAVDVLPGSQGSSHNGIGLDVVSISSGEKLFAIHKNGSLDNVSQNGATDESKWQNIIQTTPYLNYTNVALKADGTIIYGESSIDGDNLWIKDTDNWENMVMISADYNHLPGYLAQRELMYVLAGVDAEGTPYLCYKSQDNIPIFSFMDSEDFKNICVLDVSINTYGNMDYVNAVALRKDGYVVAFIEGNVTMIEAENVIDVCISRNTVYTLSSDGIVRDGVSGETVAKDAIEIFKDKGKVYYITRTGKIGQDGPKTVIYDEWLLRME